MGYFIAKVGLTMLVIALVGILSCFAIDPTRDDPYKPSPPKIAAAGAAFMVMAYFGTLFEVVAGLIGLWSA